MENNPRIGKSPVASEGPFTFGLDICICFRWLGGHLRTTESLTWRRAFDKVETPDRASPELTKTHSTSLWCRLVMPSLDSLANLIAPAKATRAD